MPRDDRSYSQAMRDYDAEKKFLRKMRHRAFHPDADSPPIFQLAGYFVRFVILLVILGAILFLRNRKYFSGESFTSGIQEEMDYYISGEDSEMKKVSWKNDQMQSSYKATGGHDAFFRSINLERITARSSWKDLLLSNGWKLEDVGIGKAQVMLKAGPSITEPESRPDRNRPSSWLSASPDFGQTRFGDIRLHEADFEWGPVWTSEGSLRGTGGILYRKLGQWKLELTGGTLNQNWLKDLTMPEGAYLYVSIEDNKLLIEDGEFDLGSDGKVTINGHIQLGETPEFNLDVTMKTISLVDILPDEFHPNIAGLADFDFKITGSPNRSDGLICEGEMIMVEGGRLREIPILRTLSVVTPRSEMRLMPIRSGSRLKFRSHKGLLTISELGIQGGGAAVGISGYKREDGEVLDFARITGGFTYQMDTSQLDSTLKLASIKRTVEDDIPEEEGPEVGFNGAIRVAMPWELLGKEEGYRAKHFTQDAAGYGWIDVPIKGLLDEITVDQAKILDFEWGELAKRARTSFD